MLQQIKKRPVRCLMSLVLAFAIIVSNGGILASASGNGTKDNSTITTTDSADTGTPGTYGANADGTNPDGTNPDGTDPDGTNPDGTNPDGTNPDGTNPDGTDPDGTNPDGTNPDGTNPDGTDPDGTDPDGTNPDGANPDGTDPDGTNPDGTNPDGTDPDGTDPDGTDPDGTNPDGTNPDGANPDAEMVAVSITELLLGFGELAITCDGNPVSNGDELEKGKELTITLTPSADPEQQLNLSVLDEEDEFLFTQSVAGNAEPLTHTLMLSGPVTVLAVAQAKPELLAGNDDLPNFNVNNPTFEYPSGGGLYTGTINSQSDLDTLLQTGAATSSLPTFTVNSNYQPMSSVYGTIWDYFNRMAYFKYDAFHITVPGGVTVTVNADLLEGRSITINGGGTVSIAGTNGAGTMQPHNQRYTYKAPATTVFYDGSGFLHDGNASNLADLPLFVADDHGSNGAVIRQQIVIGSGITVQTINLQGEGDIYFNSGVNMVGGSSSLNIKGSSSNNFIGMAGGIIHEGNIYLENVKATTVGAGAVTAPNFTGIPGVATNSLTHVWHKSDGYTVYTLGVSIVNSELGNSVAQIKASATGKQTGVLLENCTATGIGLIDADQVTIDGGSLGTIGAIYGNTTVTGGAVGTVQALYAKGESALGSANMTYNSIWGGGTAKGTTTLAPDGITMTYHDYTGDVDLGMTAGTITTSLYGGSNNNYSGNIIMKVAGTILCDVYGGVDSSDPSHTATSTDVTLTNSAVGSSSSPKNVYGGSKNKVTGNTKVTVSGGRIYGTVYGGGDGATVGGSTTVSISNSCIVEQSVYGGGENADVSSSTSVTVSGGTIKGSVVGGGYADTASANVGGNTTVAVSGGSSTSIHYNVVGGGWVRSTFNATVEGNTSVTISGLNTTVQQYVYGGGYISAGSGSATVNGSATVTVNNGPKIMQSVYGGGYTDTYASGSATVVKKATVSVGSNVNGSGVYGGGYKNTVGAGLPPGSEATAVTINSGADITGSVYGGNDSLILTGNTRITINGGQVKQNVYGGSNAELNGSSTISIANGLIYGSVYGGGQGAKVTGNTSVTMGSGTVNGSVYGGGNDSNAGVSGKATVTMSSGTVQGSLYGGGYKADVSSTTVTVSGGTVYQNIYGGSYQADIWGTAVVSVKNSYVGLNSLGTVVGDGNIYGGSNEGDIVLATTVTVASKTAGSVYGGSYKGNSGGSTINFTTVTINSENNFTDIHGDVYGGGAYCQAGSVTDYPGAQVTVNNGVIRGSVYGGSREEALNGPSKVTVNGGSVGNSVYGGSYKGDVVHVTMVPVTINGGIVQGNVYGGGYDGLLTTPTSDTADTTVAINAGAQVNGSVYGGGYYTTIGRIEGVKNTTVDIRGKVGTDVYGGGYGNYVEKTQVTVYSTADVTGTVYGGGHAGNVTTSDRMDVKIYGKVGSVYGGGRQGDVSTSDGTYVLVEGPSAYVSHDVFGGGRLGHTAKTDIFIHYGATVVQRVFGGGNSNDMAIPSAPGTNATVPGDSVILIEDAATTVGLPSFVSANASAKSQSPDPDHINWGNVYGGGLDADVQDDTDITIQNLNQKVIGMISGGNYDSNGSSATYYSGSANRTITLNNLGEWVVFPGDDSCHPSPPYTDLSKYLVVYGLQDYTTASANSSYLTVYYHLNEVDNSTAKNQHTMVNSTLVPVFDMNGGVYNPWRPRPHTVIQIDPVMNFNGGAQFRVESGYAIEMKQNGIFPNNPTGDIALLIDRPDGTTATTTKIYGIPSDTQAPGNIRVEHPYEYETGLPRTTVVRNITDYNNSSNILGISIYIPPYYVSSAGGNNTSPGGSNALDQNTGKTDYVDRGTSSGGSGGGGGGGGKGGRAVTSATPLSGSLGVTATVSKTVTLADLLAKVRQAAKAVPAGKTAIVVEQDANVISTDMLRLASQAARSLGRNVVIHADVRKGLAVQSRMVLDPANAPQTNASIYMGISTQADKTMPTYRLFEKYYANLFTVVHLEHKGAFGMNVEVVTKVDINRLNTKSLLFYSYNPRTNAYVSLANPRAYVDAAGYLHFYTSYGDDIVITDQPLKHK